MHTAHQNERAPAACTPQTMTLRTKLLDCQYTAVNKNHRNWLCREPSLATPIKRNGKEDLGKTQQTVVNEKQATQVAALPNPVDTLATRTPSQWLTNDSLNNDGDSQHPQSPLSTIGRPSLKSLHVNKKPAHPACNRTQCKTSAPGDPHSTP